MSEQKEIVQKLEEIGLFLAKFDEKILNILEKHDNLSEDQEKIKENLRQEINKLNLKIESYNTQIQNIKLEQLKNKSEIEIQNLEHKNKIQRNERYTQNISKVVWIGVGCGITLLLKYLF